MEKRILIDKRADKELRRFSRSIQIKFQALFQILEQKGQLEEPFGKKLSGAINLFEMRIRYQGQWRALYAYIEKDLILVLSAFVKKTQKTSPVELEKARKRLSDYK